MGERTVGFSTNEGQQKKIKFQVADINKILISVDKLVDAGNAVHLDRKAPRIVTPNGDNIPLRRKDGVFVLDMWIRRAKEQSSRERGFQRQ